MTVTYRRGTVDDSLTALRIFQNAIIDMRQRQGTLPLDFDEDRDELLATSWEDRRSLYEHLATTSDEFWLAEVDGLAFGYARSILRGTTRELTEFFVLPGQQAGGVGRELLKRAFPREGAEHRIIVATLDTRALALYLKSGVTPRFPGCYFELPQGKTVAPVKTDLDIRPVENTPETLAAIAAIDTKIIGHARDVDHAWLLGDRQGFLYYRRKKPVGYGYLGKRTGPFALLKDSDYPAVLSHAALTTLDVYPDFGVEVPLINKMAVDYLLANGFTMDGFYEFLMTDKPFGKFENYIFTSPPLFL